MKKSVTLLFAVMLMPLVGCQHDGEEPLLNDEHVVFTASTEAFIPTSKTSMTAEKTVVWSADDRVAVFQGASVADEYMVTQSSVGTSNATLTKVEVNSDENADFTAGVEVPGNVAYYPYSSGLALSGSAFDNNVEYRIDCIILPEVQKYAPKSFANGAFPMIAVTESLSEHTLKFKNVLGVINLQLTGNKKIKSIKIEGANGEKLSGEASLTVSSDNSAPVIKMPNGNNSVTLDCGNGVLLDPDKVTDFYIALPPTKFKNGFSVEVTDPYGMTEVFTAKVANTVFRSSILVMPPVEVPGLATGGGTEDVNKGDDVNINFGK